MQHCAKSAELFQNCSVSVTLLASVDYYFSKASHSCGLVSTEGNTKMLTLIILCFVSCQFMANCEQTKSPQVDLYCSGRPYYNVSLTAYYPDFKSGIESDYLDIKGKKLRTLQNFLDGRAEFVTVSVDENLNMNYGSVICVPELNEHFGRKIPLHVRDHGANLRGFGLSRLDICVRSEEDSYDDAVNRIVTVYV